MFEKYFTCRVPLILIGNKSDLHMHRQVSYKEGEDLAKAWGAKFQELSALKPIVRLRL